MSVGAPLTEVKKRGQPYVDTPIYLRPKKIVAAVRKALGLPQYPTFLIRYERHKLEWK